MQSNYIDRYDAYREEGFKPLEAFGIVCIGISTGGTMEDLKELDKHFSKDSSKLTDKLIRESEELENESTTRTISAV